MACSNLTPFHGLHRPNPASASQFFVSQSSLGYTTADQQNITVEIATHSNERKFRGFIVQAYDPTSGHKIGQFVQSEESRPVASCSAATHRNHSDKKQVLLTWMPPAASSTTKQAQPENPSNLAVRFRATIVVSYEEFYTGFESSEHRFEKFDYANKTN